MKLLAIDTATEACSAALLINDRIYERYQLAPRQHNQLIFPMMESLLDEAGLPLSDIDVLAFGRGPGSFTGVRIATSIIQGLALAHDKPVVAVSTLQAMAQGAARQWSADYALVAIDARMQEVYWGCYQQDTSGTMLPLSEEQVIAPERMTMPQKANWTALGSGWQAHGEVLEQRVDGSLAAIHSQYYPQAQDIVYLARLAYNAGQAIPAAQALPIYLRDKVTQ